MGLNPPRVLGYLVIVSLRTLFTQKEEHVKGVPPSERGFHKPQCDRGHST